MPLPVFPRVLERDLIVGAGITFSSSGIVIPRSVNLSRTGRQISSSVRRCGALLGPLAASVRKFTVRGQSARRAPLGVTTRFVQNRTLRPSRTWGVFQQVLREPDRAERRKSGIIRTATIYRLCSSPQVLDGLTRRGSAAQRRHDTGSAPDLRNTVQWRSGERAGQHCRQHSPAHVPWRLHPVHRRLARRPVDRARATDGDVCRRQ
jgi:hypothetical protein